MRVDVPKPCMLEAAVMPNTAEMRRCPRCQRSAADLLNGYSCEVSKASAPDIVARQEAYERRVENSRLLLLARDEVLLEGAALEADEQAARDAEHFAKQVLDMQRQEAQWYYACLDVDQRAERRCLTPGPNDYPKRDHFGLVRGLVWVPFHGPALTSNVSAVEALPRGQVLPTDVNGESFATYAVRYLARL